MPDGKFSSFKSALNAVSILSIGTILGSISAFGVQVLMARNLEPYEFGIFFSVLMVITLMVPIAGCGVSQYWLRMFGAEGWGALGQVKASLKLVFVCTVATIFLLSIWGWAGPHDESVGWLYFFLSIFIIGQISFELVHSKLLLEERYLHLAIYLVVPHSLRLVFLLVLIQFYSSYFSLVSISVVYMVVSILVFFFAIPQIKKINLKSFKLAGHEKKIESASKINRSGVVAVFSKTWLFSISGFLYLVYFQVDIVLLNYLSTPEETGLYSSAFLILLVVYIFPGIVFQKFLLPKLHRWQVHNREAFSKTYKYSNIIMLVLGGGSMLFIWVISGWLILFVFGNSYSGAILLLDLMALTMPIAFMLVSTAAFLVSGNHMKEKIVCMLWGGALNILLNLILIPEFDGAGAIVATFISSLVLLYLYFRVLKKHVFSEPSV